MTLLVLHLAAVLLAAIALWAMRHEITEKAGNDLDWVLGPALAVVVAAILLIVSPGKRFELWLAGIAVGLLLGAAAAFLASYLAARYLVIRFYKAPRSIHLDMPRGQNPRRTLVH